MGGCLSTVRGDELPLRNQQELIPSNPFVVGGPHMHPYIPASEDLENEARGDEDEDGEAELCERNQEEEELIPMTVTPSTPLFAVGSPHSHTSINIPQNLGNRPSVVAGIQNRGSELPVRNEEETISTTLSNPFDVGPYNSSGMPSLVFMVILVVMAPGLIGLASLKFENQDLNAFDTHPAFANIAVVSYIIAVTTAVSLFYINNLSASSTRKSFSPVCYMILNVLVCFSGFLSPLSLGMVFIPDQFNWIGYLSIGALLGVVITCYFGDCKKIFGKKDVSISKACQSGELLLNL